MKRRAITDSGQCGESRAQPVPPPPPVDKVWIGVPDENMHHAGWKKTYGERGWAGLSAPAPLKPFGGTLGGGGRLEML
jgi:hypothetical protein